MATKKSSTKQANKKSAPTKKQNIKKPVTDKNSKKQEKQPKVKNYRVRSIILFCAGFVSIFLFIIKGNILWQFFRNILFGLFGVPAMLLPVVLCYFGFMNAKEKEIHRLKAKVVLCLSIVTLTAMEIYIFTGTQYGNYFAELGRQFSLGYKGEGLFSRGGGILGSVLGYPMSYFLGNIVSVIIITVALIGIFLIITGASVLDIKKPVEAAKKQMEKHRSQREQAKQEENLVADFPPHYDERIDIPIDDKDKNRKNIFYKKKKDEPKVDNSSIDDNSTEEKSQHDNIIDIIKKANQNIDNMDTTPEKAVENVSKKKKTDALIEAAKMANSEISVDEIESEAKALENEIKNNEGTAPKYQLPPIQLLKLADNRNAVDARNEMQEKAEKLVSTLDSFGVKVTITNICRGPSVTRYELQPAPGVKISKITNLADDIALNLAANGVRIEAPIPGKAAVGIEVPNKAVTMVSMRELIDSDTFRNAKSKLTCVLGRDISGEIVTTDLAAMPHLLIAGTTGSGKSVCVNSLLMSILYRATPDEVKFLLIDPKMVEFSKYKGIPHLLVPVVSDAKKAAAALNWAVSEMLSRYKIFSEYDCKDINSYNDLVESNLKFIEEQTVPEGEEPEVMEVNGLPVAKEKMFRCVIAIDELADLMMAAPSEVEESICRLAQMARAAGMHLVIATQRPSVNVITGVIKANIPSRISLKVSSNIDSRTILDFGGAEKLIGKGDMLYSPVGAPKPIRVQGCFAGDSEIEGVTSYIKNHHRSQYNEEVEERIKKITVEGMENDPNPQGGNSGDYDEKIEEAIKIVLDAGQASTSLVQRRLKVGYARAGRIIDEMEELGIVGPHQGSKPREVLLTYQEWLERRNINGDKTEEVPSEDE
jgi:S-DNA-T family DNA segregation ATPase FtsK/SpoIIIE